LPPFLSFFRLSARVTRFPASSSFLHPPSLPKVYVPRLLKPPRSIIVRPSFFSLLFVTSSSLFRGRFCAGIYLLSPYFAWILTSFAHHSGLKRAVLLVYVYKEREFRFFFRTEFLGGFTGLSSRSTVTSLPCVRVCLSTRFLSFHLR